MTFVVNESCIRRKIMDCVDVCPVDCFYEGENMLVIHPDECIDCGVCVPECPVDPTGEFDPQAFLATDLNAHPRDIHAWFVSRWCMLLKRQSWLIGIARLRSFSVTERCKELGNVGLQKHPRSIRTDLGCRQTL